MYTYINIYMYVFKHILSEGAVVQYELCRGSVRRSYEFSAIFAPRVNRSIRTVHEGVTEKR